MSRQTMLYGLLAVLISALMIAVGYILRDIMFVEPEPVPEMEVLGFAVLDNQERGTVVEVVEYTSMARVNYQCSLPHGTLYFMEYDLYEIRVINYPEEVDNLISDLDLCPIGAVVEREHGGWYEDR
jgi:hypothetical protein